MIFEILLKFSYQFVVLVTDMSLMESSCCIFERFQEVDIV